jgi:hypothetical protein
MKKSDFLRMSVLVWFALGVAGDSAADSFRSVETQSRPIPLERSGGAFVELAEGAGWIFLLHGGLPAGLDARPVSEVWVFDGSDWRSVNINAPAVYGHTLVAAGRGRAFGFGGVNADDELIRLDRILSFRVNSGEAGPEVAIEEMKVRGPNPGTCSESPVVRLEDRDSMLLIGGMCNYYPGRSAEVWEYDVSANSWQRRADLPRPLVDHTAVEANGRVWVFGGNGDGGLSNDIYRYDPQFDSWTEVFATGGRPEPMRDHRAVAVGDSMVVFGGTRDPFWPETIAEVWELDLMTFQWTQKSNLPHELAEMAVGVVPSNLADHCNTQVLLFGGVVEAWSFPLVLSDATWIYTSDIARAGELIAVPAVAHVRGRGAFFTSTVYLMNAGETDLDLAMTFTPRIDMAGASMTVNYTIGRGVMEKIDDPLGTLFGFSEDEKAVGSLLVEVVKGSSEDLLIQTFVEAEADSGEGYGSYFPAIRTVDALGVHEVGYLTTTENPAVYRVNVGVMALADATEVKITPVTRMRESLADAVTFDLNSGDNTQINNIHGFFGIGPVADVMVEIAVQSGRAVAYATVLDGKGSYSGTSDPTTVLPIVHGSEKVTLLEIGSIQGIDEFSGSATIVNHSGWEAELRADFFERGTPGVTGSQILTIRPGEALGYGDFVGEVFGILSTVGTVVLNSLNGALISATGREFAIQRDQSGEQIIGTAGTQLPGLNDADLLAPGGIWHVFGMRQMMAGAERERSHLAVFNPGLEGARITVSLFNGSDGVAEGSRSWIVQGQEMIHINSVMKKINSGVDGKEKRIQISVDRSMYLHVFRVNTWGDSVTLRAERR